MIVVHEPAPRLPAVGLGPLHADASGTGSFLLGSIGMFAWLFLLFIRAAAGDLDLGDARAGARERAGEAASGPRMSRPNCAAA